MGLFSIPDKIFGTDLSGDKARASAERSMQAGTDKANAIQKEMFDITRKDNEPWRQAGAQALSGLQDPNFGKNFQMDPGYEFRMKEGQKAINAAASARGMAGGGATLKALTKYGQDYSSNEYSKVYDRNFNKLSTLAGFGSQANQAQGQANQNYGQQVAGNYLGMANAQAASAMNQSNMQNQLIGQGIGAAALAFSDVRLKTKIERLEPSIYKDVPTYRFEYKNKKHGVGTHVGVMAQDLLKQNWKHPAVVKDRATGYYKVDYSKLEVI